MNFMQFLLKTGVKRIEGSEMIERNVSIGSHFLDLEFLLDVAKMLILGFELCFKVLNILRFFKI